MTSQYNNAVDTVVNKLHNSKGQISNSYRGSLSIDCAIQLIASSTFRGKKGRMRKTVAKRHNTLKLQSVRYKIKQ